MRTRWYFRGIRDFIPFFIRATHLQQIVHEKGDTFAPWLTSDSTVDVLSLINIKGDSNLQEKIRTLCTEFKDIFSNELPAEPA